MTDIEDADPWRDPAFSQRMASHPAPGDPGALNAFGMPIDPDPSTPADMAGAPDSAGAAEVAGVSEVPGAPAPRRRGRTAGRTRGRKAGRGASRGTGRGSGRGAGRGRGKPAIVRAKEPLTRQSLPETAALEQDTPEATELQSLWDLGVVEAQQFAVMLRTVATYWPQDPDPDHDLRDEAEYVVAQALRTTLTHASRLLGDAHKATTDLPGLLSLTEAGQLPARWLTFVLRRTNDLTKAALAELDASIASWDLRVDEGRFSRQLSALVRWLRDQHEATTPTPPTRSVDVMPPDEDGTACLQIHGPAPEILALGRRLDSAARAVQQAQRHALDHGDEHIPFDDGTAAERGTALSRSRLRYEILTRTLLDTGGIEVPKERFRITVTVPALTLLGVENGPGLLDGIHPLPAAMARELAGQEATWYRVLTDATKGAFLPLPADRYTPTRAMLEYLRLANPVCAVPGCQRPTSWASQMDHIEEYNHREPENGGRTEIFNLHPLCWRHHQLKTAKILDPTKESITHPTTGATGATATGDVDGTKPPPGDHPPDDPPRKSPPDKCPDGDTPEKETVTGFNPGVTHWRIRGSTPLRADDECDLITPWLLNAFTTQQNHTHQHITAHQAPPTNSDNNPANPSLPEPPPF